MLRHIRADRTHVDDLWHGLADELSIHPSRDILLGVLVLHIHVRQVYLLGLLISEHESFMQLSGVSVSRWPSVARSLLCDLLDTLHTFSLRLDTLCNFAADFYRQHPSN